MEQKEIIENNKLIAEFMGANSSEYGNYMIFTIHNPQYIGKINHDEIKYHSSWSWLMPVVEKIESLGHFVTIVKNRVRIPSSLGEGIFIGTESKLQSTYQAVIQFITYYNQNLK